MKPTPIFPARRAGILPTIGFCLLPILVLNGCRSVEKEDGKPAPQASAAMGGAGPTSAPAPGSTESPGK